MPPADDANVGAVVDLLLDDGANDDDDEEYADGADGDGDGDGADEEYADGADGDGDDAVDDGANEDDDADDNEAINFVNLASYNRRMTAYKTVLERLARTRGASCVRDLDGTFAAPFAEQPQQIGKGNWGSVYGVQIGRRGVAGMEPVPVAVKVQPLRDETPGDMAVAELVSSFVGARVVPNFPVVYRNYTCKAASEGITVMERARKNLRQVMKGKGTARIQRDTYIGVLFQVFAAVVTLHTAADVVHNDVKLSNVLVSPAPDNTQFVYNIHGNRYVVPVGKYVALLSDFSISSGAMTGVAHDDVPCKYRNPEKKPIRIQQYYHDPKHTNRELKAAEESKTGVHVLDIDISQMPSRARARNAGERIRPRASVGKQYKPIPAYARDYWLILYQFLRLHARWHPNRPLAWIKVALENLRRFEMNSPGDSLDYFNFIFSPDALDQGEIDRDYFGGDAQQNAQTFRL